MTVIEIKETRMQKFNILFAVILMVILFLVANSTFLFAQSHNDAKFHEVGLNDPSIGGISNTASGFKIYQSSANSVKFDVPKSSSIKIGIYDNNNNLVRTYIYNNLNAGTYEINLSSGNLDKGTYTCVMNAGTEQESSKITID
jgi:hypothetical protein